MRVSENELSALLRKAALGAGLVPGLADELAAAGIAVARQGQAACIDDWLAAPQAFTAAVARADCLQAGLDAPKADAAICRALELSRSPGQRFPTGGLLVDAALWDALTALAARTLVPATEASRRAGAGAGLTDND